MAFIHSKAWPGFKPGFTYLHFALWPTFSPILGTQRAGVLSGPDCWVDLTSAYCWPSIDSLVLGVGGGVRHR